MARYGDIEKAVDEINKIIHGLEKRTAYKEGYSDSYTHMGMPEQSVKIWNPHEIYYTRIDGRLQGLDMTIEVLKNLPSADVVEVIRCKDCKYYMQNDNTCHEHASFRKWLPNDYCSFAERKEDGE